MYVYIACTLNLRRLVVVELCYNSLEFCLDNFFFNVTAPFYSFLSTVLLVILPKMTKQYMLITQSHSRYRNDFFKFQL